MYWWSVGLIGDLEGAATLVRYLLTEEIFGWIMGVTQRTIQNARGPFAQDAGVVPSGPDALWGHGGFLSCRDIFRAG